jgi:hypothetical protein
MPLVFWSKAAKALSTTPSKGVAFAGYNACWNSKRRWEHINGEKIPRHRRGRR